MQNVREELLRRHGALLTGAQAAKLLKYPSVNAMSMASRRGHIDLKPLVRRRGPKGNLYLTEAVAKILQGWLDSAKA